MKFEFSQYISNIQLQYVVTRDLQTFQKWMKKKKYDIVLSKSSIDVTYHVTQNRKIDIDAAGHELCAEIKHFLADHSSKPILVPEKANTEYVNTLTEINQENHFYLYALNTLKFNTCNLHIGYFVVYIEF